MIVFRLLPGSLERIHEPPYWELLSYLMSYLTCHVKSLYTESFPTSDLIIYCTLLYYTPATFAVFKFFTPLFYHFPILFLKLRIFLSSFLPIQLQVNAIFSVKPPLFHMINSDLIWIVSQHFEDASIVSHRFYHIL